MSHMSLEAIFQQTLQRHGLLRPDQTVLVAVSGGPDSTALLHLLVGLREKTPLEIHVGHFDHGLRGEESDADREFVADLARRLGLPLVVQSLSETSVQAGLSEAKARELRYRFLEAAADEIGADRIATGHTQDDQAETVLLNLLRGAGSDGLAGIPPRRGRIVRPLQEAPRSEVMAWLGEHGHAFREDSSNLDPVFTRNRIRHELIPHLESLDRPGLRRRLAATAELLRDESTLLEELARQHYRDLSRRAPGQVALDAAGLEALPVALARRVLRQAYREACQSSYAPGMQAVEALRALASRQAGGSLSLPGGFQAVREEGDLVLRQEPPKAPAPFEAAAEVPGRLAWPEAGIFLKMQGVDRTSLGSDIREESREIAHLDLDQTGRHLVLRNRRPGDIFHPLGLPGRKKLQDFLVDARVPRRDRDRVGVLTAGDQVVWLVGHRLDDRFKVTPATRNVLVVRQEME